MKIYHRLTEVDLVLKRGVCSTCGPTEIWSPTNTSRRLCIVSYQRQLSANNISRKERALGRKPVRHRLNNIDANLLKATCNICGEVNAKKKTSKGRIRWECETKWREYREIPEGKGHGLSRAEAERFVLRIGQCQNQGCGKVLFKSGREFDGGQVDHDHITSEIRGVLCGACNRALGVVFDSIDILQGLIEYLTNPPGYTTDKEQERQTT